MKSGIAVTLFCFVCSIFALPRLYAKESTADVEKLTVTGSHIGRIDLEGNLPVTVFTREDINNSGSVSIRDFLQSYRGSTTAFNGGGTSVAGGIATISLRGLGPGRTLILVDGIRLPKHPEYGATDLNSIPLIAVERIEILQQGASSIYGADAVGGAVNIITKKFASGSQVSFYEKRPIKSGGSIRSIEGTVGINSDNSNSVLSLTYSKQDSLLGSERLFSRDSTSSFGYPGVYYGLSEGPQDADGQIKSQKLFFPSEGCSTYNASAGTVSPARNCPFYFNRYNTITPSYERLSAVYNLTYNMSKNLKLRGSLIGTNQLSESKLRPESTDDISITSVINQSVIDNMSQERFDRLFPGFKGQKPKTGGVGLQLRLSDFGSSVTNKEATLIGSTIGLEGESASSWNWKISASAAGSKTTSKASNKLRIDELNQALQAGDIIPWESEPRGEIVSNILSQAYYVENSKLFGSEILLARELSVFDDTPIELAIGGGLQGEDFGIEWDKESKDLKLLNVAGSGGKGDRNLVFGFVESRFLFDPSFESTLAARYDQYSDIGSALSPQLGLLYSPHSTVKIRGSIGKAYKAPTLKQMYGDTGISFNGIIDYPFCDENGISMDQCIKSEETKYQAKNLRSSNSNLLPEKSDVFNFGTLIQPEKRTMVSIDYWRIDSKNLVDRRNIQDLINNNDARVKRNLEGKISYVELPWENLSRAIRSGLDLGLSYRLTQSKTSLTYSSLATRYLEDKFQPIGKAFENRLGRHESFKWKWQNTLDLEFVKKLGFSLSSMTLSSHGKLADSSSRLPEYTRYDGQFRYYHDAGGQLSVGVNNISNKQGGIDSTNSVNIVNSSVYDVNGREYYLKISQNF